MPHDLEKYSRMFATVLLILVATLSVAHAEDDDEGWPQQAVSNDKWVTECTACHVAYPPRFLPAESWRAIMSGLDKHFGSNAGLDAESANEITAFLVKNADTRAHPVLGKPLLRLTETSWFKSDHREVAAHVWKNIKIRSPANCGACHPKADRGDFSEDDVKIPK